MILPIVAYGSPVLKQKALPINTDYENLEKLIRNMFETMENANGVGLAAPQIGKSIRMFIVDASPFAEDGEEFAHLKDFRKTFINAEKVEEAGTPWKFEEGCLSIPDIREEVERPESITLRYFDEHFKEHTETFDGFAARIIQHEYDHIDGILFTDYLNPLRKQLLKRRLQDITKGKIEPKYRMRFPKKNKK